MNIIEVLVRDTLEKHQVGISSAHLNALVQYVSYPKTRAMVFEGSTAIVENVIRKRIHRNGELLQENILIGDSEFSSYLESEAPFNFVENVKQYDDVLRNSVENQIPLSRLTYGSELIEDCSPVYLKKLDEVYRELVPVLNFMKANGAITEVFQDEYAATIREFLKNEFIKERDSSVSFGSTKEESDSRSDNI